MTYKENKDFKVFIFIRLVAMSAHIISLDV